MRTLCTLLLIALTSLAAEDSWSKVRELKSGAEIRVFKKGMRQPLLAKADEATDDKLMVVVKNEQVAIPKADIERVDARPVQTKQRIIKETHETTELSKEPNNAAHPRSADVPASSSSTNVSLGGKPDFETIYRHAPSLK